MIFHENRLPADDYHEISCLVCYFQKGVKMRNCRLLQIIGGALRANVNIRHKSQKEFSKRYKLACWPIVPYAGLWQMKMRPWKGWGPSIPYPI